MYKLYPVIFAKFAVNVWNVDNDFDSLENLALEGIKRLENFYKEINMPVRLSNVNIPANKFDEIAEKCDKIGNIKKTNKKDILEILKLAL